MLHFAPEHCFAERLRTAPNVDWLSADLLDPSAMLKVDITRIQLPDDSFDVIYCSHVLEHVPDDRAGMRELARVLKPSGWALVQVPIASPTTFEDPSITDPDERERVFGQWNHVRTYGPDVEQRLSDAGFVVQRVSASDIASPEEYERMGLRDNDWIYVCRPRTGIEGSAVS